MEEDQRNLNIDEKKLEFKNLLISKPEEEIKDGASSSNEDKKKSEDTKKKSEDTKKKSEDSKKRSEDAKKKSEDAKKKSEDTNRIPEDSDDKPEQTKDKILDSPLSPQKEVMPPQKEPIPIPRPPTPNRGSPEPSCAICLEQLTNKSFTNSCFHMFCFTCLVEWSKVKPECPLCKQSFTSIVHNVKSFQEYDQYHINARSRTPDSIWSFDRRFRYNTTMTSDRYLSRAQQAIETSIVNEIASHRLRYAPHSVHHMRMYSQPQMARRMPCVYRRRIYEESLWVRPPAGDRIRIATPVFFQRNIACTHRLLPWLNRELLVVMPHNEGEIGFMIDLIMSLILKYNITSQEFFTHIEPYTAPYTSHFIHELYNFAISPYEMESYDFHAQYEIDPMESIRVVSSPDSDVIPLPMSDTAQKGSTSSDASKRKKKHSRERHLAKYRRRLEKIVLKRNSENNCWETVATSFPMLNYNEVSSTNRFEGPGPSTSWDTVLQDFAETSRQDLEKSSEVECVQDDEIEIVEVLKPKCERTPEIVNLSSGDEQEYTATAEVSSTVKEAPAGVIELSSDVPISSADEDDVMFLEEKNTFPKTVISDKPIDYSIKAADKSIEVESEKSKSDENEPVLTSSRENTETEQRSESPKKCSNLKSAVRVLTNDNDSRSSSWSPFTKPKKRRATILDDSSTESCSEGAQVSELDSRIKKLKLRSVVAHFSFDPSDEKNDSTHHSSLNKRHKDRKKKKKKHKHRHHRIYSSEST